LDVSLEEARGILAVSTAAALTLIDERARLARIRIAGAAARGHARRMGEIGHIKGDMTSRHTTADALERDAQGRQQNVQSQGDQAATALGGMAKNPTGAYPLEGDTALIAAQNEAIVNRLPPRATERQGATAHDASGLFKHLQPAITNLHTQITNAFAPFDAMITSLTGPARQAVDHARDSASSQVRDTRKALREAVQQGRISAETALVQQHDAARRQ